MRMRSSGRPQRLDRGLELLDTALGLADLVHSGVRDGLVLANLSEASTQLLVQVLRFGLHLSQELLRLVGALLLAGAPFASAGAPLLHCLCFPLHLRQLRKRLVGALLRFLCLGELGAQEGHLVDRCLPRAQPGDGGLGLARHLAREGLGAVGLSPRLLELLGELVGGLRLILHVLQPLAETLRLCLRVRCALLGGAKLLLDLLQADDLRTHRLRSLALLLQLLL
mmetsp:Transcript_66634/g.171522  ORF Transcript_66634/g.171522 Transcript_66634/m.171522 type:complete len:225 (+) Transcript_66634:95-769(+)